MNKFVREFSQIFGPFFTILLTGFSALSISNGTALGSFWPNVLAALLSSIIFSIPMTFWAIKIKNNRYE